MISALEFLSYELLSPAWLGMGLLVGLLLLAFTLWGLRQRRRELSSLVVESQFSRFAPSFSKGRARTRAVLVSLAGVCLAFALVVPVRGFTLREVQQRGLDIVLAIDTSRSMLVQDLSPSRLARARREVSGLLENLSGDRAALLAFAGDVREVAPLTHDRKTLSAFVNDLNTEENLQGGTNLGAAIDRALELFDGRTGAHEAIILLTDGEDLQGEGIAAAERAKEQGIKLFVVGMGSSQGGKIPNGRGGFVRDENGQEVISALDYDSLKELSRITGGTMLTTDQSPFPLQELYEKRLSKLDERDLVAGKERIPRDRYQEPLALAALLMMAEMGLRERRKRGENS